MQCAESRLPSADVPFSFLYFYVFLCCILYADFYFPPSYCITYECLPFLPQSICLAFSSPPLVSGINSPASKSKIKAFVWSQEPKMQLLHTSERKGKEEGGRAQGEMPMAFRGATGMRWPPGQHGVLPVQPLAPATCRISPYTNHQLKTCHLPGAAVMRSQCRGQTGAVVCYPAREPPYIPAHPPPPPASLASTVSLVIRPIHRYYTKNYMQSTTLGLCSF